MEKTDTRKLSGVARFVDENRLWERHMIMATIGATPSGGLDRQALTSEDIEARSLFARWAGELAFDCEMDPIGNMFVRRPGTEESAAPVMSGSHLDTQPAGGRFDGIFGVLAALEALQAIDQAGIKTRRPIEVVNWTNEEGSRFQPAIMGSSAFVRPDQLNEFFAARDCEGIPFQQEVLAARTALQHVSTRPLGSQVAAFVEAHIEQGTVLENDGKVLGVVTGIQGVRRFLAHVDGEAGHVGTTPNKARKDALRAACKMINALGEFMQDPEDLVRFTVGRATVVPNSPGTIPEHVEFTVDLRHPDALTLSRLGDQVAEVCHENAAPCAAVVEEILTKDSVELSQTCVSRLIRKAAGDLQIPWMDVYSPAIHDAVNLARICPTGMIFVPCEDGITHDEAENAKASDLADGARVLAEVLVELANI